ncbi:TPM domain-containing protein [Neolewinella aurantiaca]|uniref:TPM domain-containing protein n=1 Tax=Neolewinella aurantiaca TaxID=2602767 RepID=A0A5C7FDP9_9BACT|nr:TPM domain-containing protein [Neolewinella aurantiaca]TXF88807.1 TPM domain-containing protein [Neolewinella aurantiaca]
MIRFFSKDEEAVIVAAIRRAELATSGEIRVHVEVGAEVAAISVAKRVFHQLGMDKTADRNGVLILLEVDRREFAIIGDTGIDKVVPSGFWDSTRDIMEQHFRKGEFTRGIELAIDEVGAQLKTYFPYQTDDVNELPDEISYGG